MNKPDIKCVEIRSRRLSELRFAEVLDNLHREKVGTDLTSFLYDVNVLQQDNVEYARHDAELRKANQQFADEICRLHAELKELRGAKGSLLAQHHINQREIDGLRERIRNVNTGFEAALRKGCELQEANEGLQRELSLSKTNNTTLREVRESMQGELDAALSARNDTIASMERLAEATAAEHEQTIRALQTTIRRQCVTLAQLRSNVTHYAREAANAKEACGQVPATISFEIHKDGSVHVKAEKIDIAGNVAINGQYKGCEKS
jgi:chromosome segregation ATPase